MGEVHKISVGTCPFEISRIASSIYQRWLHCADGGSGGHAVRRATPAACDVVVANKLRSPLPLKPTIFQIHAEEA
jgi:hypothetical protein